jgi:hypothetical protein
VLLFPGGKYPAPQAHRGSDRLLRCNQRLLAHTHGLSQRAAANILSVRLARKQAAATQGEVSCHQSASRSSPPRHFIGWH